MPTIKLNKKEIEFIWWMTSLSAIHVYQCEVPGKPFIDRVLMKLQQAALGPKSEVQNG